MGGRLHIFIDQITDASAFEVHGLLGEVQSDEMAGEELDPKAVELQVLVAAEDLGGVEAAQINIRIGFAVEHAGRSPGFTGGGRGDLIIPLLEELGNEPAVVVATAVNQGTDAGDAGEIFRDS